MALRQRCDFAGPRQDRAARVVTDVTATLAKNVISMLGEQTPSAAVRALATP
jgi:hypothetical protein